MALDTGDTRLPRPQSGSTPADQRDQRAGFATPRRASGHCRETHRQPPAGSHHQDHRCPGSGRHAGIDRRRRSRSQLSSNLISHLNFHCSSRAGDSGSPCGFDSEPPTLWRRQRYQRHPGIESAVAFRISGLYGCPRSRRSLSDRRVGFGWRRAQRESRFRQPRPRRGRSPSRSPLALPSLPQRWPARRDRNQHRHFIFLERRGFHELPFQHSGEPLGNSIQESL